MGHRDREGRATVRIGDGREQAEWNHGCRAPARIDGMATQASPLRRNLSNPGRSARAPELVDFRKHPASTPTRASVGPDGVHAPALTTLQPPPRCTRYSNRGTITDSGQALGPGNADPRARPGTQRNGRLGAVAHSSGWMFENRDATKCGAAPSADSPRLHGAAMRHEGQLGSCIQMSLRCEFALHTIPRRAEGRHPSRAISQYH